MAGKKPAKRNVTNVKEVKKELPGKAVMYHGLLTAGFTCPTCNRQLIKGIIYEQGSEAFCSRSCIPKVEAV